MTDLTLTTHTHLLGAIVDTVLAENRAEVAPDAFVFPASYSYKRGRKPALQWSDPVKRVRNWGWLRRIAQGYSEPALVHPNVGTTFYVRTWRYGQAKHLGMHGTGPLYATHENFGELTSRDCIFIARLSDGCYFADAWSDRSVLWDALNRWRNAQGHLIDWQDRGMSDPPTCAIGGLDWKTIPERIAEHRARQMRERERAT